MEIKEKGKRGGRKARKRREMEAVHPEVFCEHLVRSLIQPPMCVTNCSARNGR